MGSLLKKLQSATEGSRQEFWANVDKAGVGGCWLWMGSISSHGYGQVGIGSTLDGSYRNKRVHRMSYEMLRGPVPPELVLDHLCRIKTCVNPDHMEIVTNKENILRGVSPSAINARKTRCNNGHELSSDNLYVRPNGDRNCLICKRAACRRWRSGRT